MGRGRRPDPDDAELGAMLRRAIATGIPQVKIESDAADPERARTVEEVLRALTRELGGGVEPRRLDPAELSALRDRVRERLRREGIDPDSGETL